MLTLTCCCRQSRVQWREQSTAALNAAMFYTLLVNLVHTQCVHVLIVISTYYIFCVHNILLLLSFSTQSCSLAGTVALPTLYLHAPWAVAVMCIHCAEALAICWTSTTEASAGYCFDCHIVYIFFSPWKSCDYGEISQYIPGCRDVSWYFPRSHMTFKMLNTTSAVPLKLWLPWHKCEWLYEVAQ